jgi:hypothetical protein
MPSHILRFNPAPELPDPLDVAITVAAFVAGLVFALTVVAQGI